MPNIEEQLQLAQKFAEEQLKVNRSLHNALSNAADQIEKLMERVEELERSPFIRMGKEFNEELYAADPDNYINDSFRDMWGEGILDVFDPPYDENN